MNFKKYINIVLLSLLLLLGSCSDKESTAKDKEQEELIKKEIRIPAGSSLYSELEGIGLTVPFIVELITALSNDVDVASIKPNSLFEVYLEANTNEFKKISYVESPIVSHQVRYEHGEFHYEFVELETEKRVRIIEGFLYGTLSQALSDKGVELAIRNQVNHALSSKINFNRQAQKGDYFKIIAEEQYYLNDKMPGTKLLYVYYSGKAAGKVEGYRYQETDSKSAYNGMYLENGTAMLSSALRLPLDRVQITSRFGYRIHPISRRKKLHTGIDYRAKRGTPVYAIAQGIVVRASWNGGFGKSVEVRHPDGIISQYAHLDRINVRHGQSVKAGTIVGAVGSTGYSTGPHLHFGIRQNNKWVNPQNYKMTSATKLEKARMQAFKKQIEEIKQKIDSLPTDDSDPLEMTTLERYRRENSKKRN
ncbi:MAG TPA: M23 family metallopeptidase [Candidatus Cloacimonadota bacterium]|nr:M23 family metallopeptidase [Candidatus Cloacimonadota bacterium]HPK40722.1 M23 family metallopeptidase [Candidatus Cloacimonadota bacterium]